MPKNTRGPLISFFLGSSLFFQFCLPAATIPEYTKLFLALSIAPAKIARNLYKGKGLTQKAKKAQILFYALRATHNLLGIYTLFDGPQGDDYIPGYQIAWLLHDIYKISRDLIGINDTPTQAHDNTNSNLKSSLDKFKSTFFPFIEGMAYTYATINNNKKDRQLQLLGESIGSLCAIIDNFLETDNNTNASNFWATAMAAQLLLTSKHFIDLNNKPRGPIPFPPTSASVIIQAIPFDDQGNMQFPSNVNRQYNECPYCYEAFENGDEIASVCNQRHPVHRNCYNSIRNARSIQNCWECRQGSIDNPTFHRLDSSLATS